MDELVEARLRLLRHCQALLHENEQAIPVMKKLRHKPWRWHKLNCMLGEAEQRNREVKELLEHIRWLRRQHGKFQLRQIR